MLGRFFRWVGEDGLDDAGDEVKEFVGDPARHELMLLGTLVDRSILLDAVLPFIAVHVASAAAPPVVMAAGVGKDRSGMPILATDCEDRGGV